VVLSKLFYWMLKIFEMIEFKVGDKVEFLNWGKGLA
jgi:hypothetical protein